MTASEKRDQIARILVEATIDGDEATCKKNGISSRTLQRWRKRLKTGDDTALAETVGAKKAKVEQGWADEIPGALRAAVKFLTKAAEGADHKDPAAIHSVAGAMKLLSEVAVTWKVLDARLARQAGQTRAPDGSVPAGAGARGASGGNGRADEGARPTVN